MEQKSEFVNKLKKGLIIMEKLEKNQELIERDLGGGLGCFWSPILGIASWIILFFYFDFSFITTSIISIGIAFIFLIVKSRNMQKSAQDPGGLIDLQKEKESLENQFHRVCGFTIDKYTKKQIHEIIDLLESGEADSFKEAASIIRSTEQHNQLLEENRKIKQQLQSTEKSMETELKALKKENIKLRRKVDDLD